MCHRGGRHPHAIIITDILISMDDLCLFLKLAAWRHSQYDISHPATPGSGQVWCGGLLSKGGECKVISYRWTADAATEPGWQRLYVTNSLFGTWDNQFYPDWLRPAPTCCRLTDTENGGCRSMRTMLTLAKSQGPSRAHEMRYPGGLHL